MIIILAFCGTKQGKLPIHNGNSYQPARSCQYLHHPLTLELAIQGLKFPFIEIDHYFYVFCLGHPSSHLTFLQSPTLSRLETSQLCTHKRSFHKTASLSDGATGIIEKIQTIQIRQESEVTRQLNPITSEKDQGRMGMTI